MFGSGYFWAKTSPVWITQQFSNLVILHLPAYEDGTECSETSAYKIQTPRNYREENIQRTEHGESLKSRIQKKTKNVQNMTKVWNQEYRRKHTTYRTWRKFEIKNTINYLFLLFSCSADYNNAGSNCRRNSVYYALYSINVFRPNLAIFRTFIKR
jgi:hypothetical protein